jgi:hypothetical protein
MEVDSLLRAEPLNRSLRSRLARLAHPDEWNEMLDAQPGSCFCV